MARRLALILALCLAASGSASASAPGAARLVIVVGNDRPAEATQAVLRYADDDAVRYHQRFEGLAEARILLTRFDEESAAYRQLYPDVRAPTRAALTEALATLRAQAATLRAQGRFVELVFVFAGHGGLVDGAPYLALEDGRIGRQELSAWVLEGIDADITHVIIDACSAASFVEQRGPLRGDRQPLSSQLLPFGSLVERHPRAGFVIAASAEGSAFEWSRFGSGVASHLIRSGLSGAADMQPPDGRVTYDELRAYLTQATAGILPAEYRQQITVIAPRALPSASVIELTPVERTTELLIDRPGRWYVRDADGHRIVDLRTGRGTARLLLPPYSPRFALIEQRDEGESRRELIAELPAGGLQRASALASAAPTLAARGVIEDSIFERLLPQPFEPQLIESDPTRTARAQPAATLPGLSFGVGYRGTLGSMAKELGPMHGLELRLELPLTSWLVVAPVAGMSHGTATPTGARDYPVSQLELGGELAFLPWRGPTLATFGIEARAQVLDQSPPYQADTVSSLAAGGLVARIRYPLNHLFSIGGGLAGGARIGKVEGDTRVRPYAALSVTASAEL